MLDGTSPGSSASAQQRVSETARPPSEVSLYLLFISFAVIANACTVESKSTRRLAGISFEARRYPVQDLTAPNAQRSIHGIWTKPATGSQVIPRWCSSAPSAALATTCGGASWACATIAAPIADATPISAWHPPSAAASVAWFLHR